MLRKAEQPFPLVVSSRSVVVIFFVCFVGVSFVRRATAEGKR